MPIGTIMDQNKRSVQKPLREGSNAAKVLLGFGDALGDVLMFGYNPRGVIKYGFGGMRSIHAAKEDRRRKRDLKRLEQRNLVSVGETEKGLEVALTEKGKLEYLRLKVLGCDLFEDERICLVVFDIPESARTTRKLLRDFLSHAGFIPIQKSVWISPFNAEKELKELFRQKKIGRWIRIFTATESS